tara:strand:- start:41 stop:460 length:420 start_codon:yes stop_codon:yes gene_type:complete
MKQKNNVIYLDKAWPPYLDEAPKIGMCKLCGIKPAEMDVKVEFSNGWQYTYPICTPCNINSKSLYHPSVKKDQLILKWTEYANRHDEIAKRADEGEEGYNQKHKDLLIKIEDVTKEMYDEGMTLDEVSDIFSDHFSRKD